MSTGIYFGDILFIHAHERTVTISKQKLQASNKQFIERENNSRTPVPSCNANKTTAVWERELENFILQGL